MRTTNMDAQLQADQSTFGTVTHHSDLSQWSPTIRAYLNRSGLAVAPYGGIGLGVGEMQETQAGVRIGRIVPGKMPEAGLAVNSSFVFSAPPTRFSLDGDTLP